MDVKLFEAIRKAYVEELREGYSRWSSEHSGLLHIGIDQREDIKHILLAPTLDGYDAFKNAFDENGACTSEDEDNIVIPFEEKLQEAMEEVEKEFIENIIFLLDMQDI